jgi:hypothetical protein
MSVSQLPLQQSVSWLQLSPGAPRDSPPHVLSHVPQLPSQQSVSTLQPAPSAAPEAPPHVLSHVPQLPPQQSELPLQATPSGPQPHAPSVHAPEQQSVGSVHESPSWAPDWPPQVLSQVPQLPLQQSPSPVHVLPSDVHAPQLPFVHAPEQQSVGSVQLVPSWLHVLAPHVPFGHVPLQQSVSCVQALPSWKQVLIAHTVLVQSPEQQSVGCAHVSPFAAHPPAPQMPPVQSWLQHCEGSEHGSPSLEQVGAEIRSASAPASGLSVVQTPFAEQNRFAQQSSCVAQGSSTAPHALSPAGWHWPAPPSALQTMPWQQSSLVWHAPLLQPQVLFAQMFEQQSVLFWHVESGPSCRHIEVHFWLWHVSPVQQVPCWPSSALHVCPSVPQPHALVSGFTLSAVQPALPQLQSGVVLGSKPSGTPPDESSPLSGSSSGWSSGSFIGRSSPRPFLRTPRIAAGIIIGQMPQWPTGVPDMAFMTMLHVALFVPPQQSLFCVHEAPVWAHDGAHTLRFMSQ